MLKTYFKLALPHIIAVAIFAIVAIVYCKPAFEGKVLQQSDVTQWKGMAQDALQYREKYGTTPLWTKSMFGGMPTYQITGIPASSYTIGALDQFFTFRLPEPMGLFFLASICFYFLAQVLGFNTIISVIGGLAYSYASYNPIIVVVGHMTKMHAIGYLPLFIGSIILLFRKKYIVGATMTAISTALFVQANHLQITYYGIIIVFFMTIYYLITWIKAKEYTHILKTAALGIIAGIMGLAVNAPLLVSTYEYGKESIRGGSALTTKDSKTTATGLNKDYALSYSMYKSEPLVMMFPHIYGGGSDPNEVDPTSSKAIETLQQMQPQIAQQIQSFVQFYWGGIGFTAGPPYVGIIICFFAIMGFSVKENTHRWWMGAAIILSFMLAAGSYLEGFNVFMVDHLPFYNKFRAPSMIIVIPTLLLGVLAMYGMAALSAETNFKDVITKYKPSFILLGLVFATVLYIYMTSDFKGVDDIQRLNQWTNIVNAQIKDPKDAAQFISPAHDIVNALAIDRKGMIESDLFKALIYIVMIGVLLFLSFKKIINQTILFVAFGVFTIFDLFQINVKYLKPDSYIEASENENAFALSPLDIALKKDTSDYRVLDLRAGIQNAFNGGALIAYHHKTVGGYNPAKLSIYQDLIENQWYKFPNCMPTANMLNTKYFITGDMNRDTIANPNACGSAWFVKAVGYKKGPAEVMDALSYFNPKDSAIIEEKDKIEDLNELQYDSLATVKLVRNDNDIVSYTSNSTKKSFAVFSEVYYKLGWKATIDDKEAPIVKTNYVLRGLVIPAGSHQIKFELKPASIEHAKQAAGIASILLWGLLVGLAVVYFKNANKKA